MGIYADWLFPCILDLPMRQKQITLFRRRIGQATEGRVRDVGIGSAVNWMFCGAQTEGVYGVDPTSELLRFAGERGRATCVPVERLCRWREAASIPWC